MATIFTDGFDKYGNTGLTGTPLNASLLQSEYTSLSINSSLVVAAPLSSTGYSLYLNYANITKTLAANYSRIIGGFRFNWSATNVADAGMIFRDGSTNQCSIFINNSGTFSVRSGGFNQAAVLGTSTTNISLNSTHYIEWDITLGATGAFTVWLDGASILTGTGNTRWGTNVSQTNGFMMGAFNNACAITIDDLYLFDSTGSINNAALNTNPRIETQFPSGDSQTQWTNTTIIGQTTSTTTNTNAPGANQIFLRRYISQVNQTINSVSLMPSQTVPAAKFKAVIYPDSAGTPNAQTLMSSGTEVTGTTTGVALVGPLVTPQALTAGTAYWIGFITDTSVNLSQNDTNTVGVKATNTYTSGAPGTCPTVTTGQLNWILWGNCTGATTNWSAENYSPPPGDVSSITSSTVNNEDLYTFPALSGTPLTVHTVAVKAHARLVGTGARTIDIRTKSSATDSAGTIAGQTPGANYGWIDSYFDADPNGTIAWTTAAVNAAVSGVKVAS